MFVPELREIVNERDHYKRWFSDSEKELEKAVGPDACWKDGSIVHNELTITIGCQQITLLPDGTYYLTDISG